MAGWNHSTRLEVVRHSALLPRKGSPLPHVLLRRIPEEAKFVLLGEHGQAYGQLALLECRDAPPLPQLPPEEFYAVRAELTKMLIQDRGFNAVVVEADFPDAFRVNLFVRGMSEDEDAEQALSDFKSFPTWMWRNTQMVDLLGWLRDRNARLLPAGRGAEAAGFYGMDVFSLHASAEKVLDYLQAVDPDAAARAKACYCCFDRYGADMMAYAYAVGVEGAPSCANAALATLKEVSRQVEMHARRVDGLHGEELAFAARCNAAVVAGAEQYYRNLFLGDELTCNIRARHFLDAVASIRDHLARRTHQPKLVLWAHNSHLGDARATDMGQRRGEVNLGQLMREKYGQQEVYSVGFTTHRGSVSAADKWDTPVRRKAVRKAMPGSYEHLFHEAGMPQFALDLRGGSDDLRAALEGPLLERSIGVIYRPQTERKSHYFHASLPRQFDAMVHLDSTEALTPLERTGAWERDWHAREDAPETFPFAV